MWLLTLILAILFGVDAFAAPAEGMLRVGAAQTDVSPLTLEGEPVTSLGIEPVSGLARYLTTSDATWMHDEADGWRRTGTSPGHDVMVVDSRDDLLVWAGTPVNCYRGVEAPAPIVRSTDGGATWVEAGPAGAVPLASWMNTGIAVAHDCSGLLLSTDSGATWSVPEGFPMGSQVTAFAVESTPESAAGLALLVGVTGEGGTSQLYRVRVSGFEPPAVEGPLQTYYALGSLEVLDDGTILLGAPQGVMRSDDRGETWSTVRKGLESTTLAQDPLGDFPANLEPGSFGLRSLLAGDDRVVVSGVDGIYRWSDDAGTWSLLESMNAEVERMAIAPGDEALYAETVDGGVIRIPMG